MTTTCEAGGGGWGVGQGIYDCGYSQAPADLPCLPYNGYYQEVGPASPLPPAAFLHCTHGPAQSVSSFWVQVQGNHGLLAVAALFGVVFCYFIGANDAANAWGSSVGSGAAVHTGKEKPSPSPVALRTYMRCGAS